LALLGGSRLLFLNHARRVKTYAGLPKTHDALEPVLSLLAGPQAYGGVFTFTILETDRSRFRGQDAEAVLRASDRAPYATSLTGPKCGRQCSSLKLQPCRRKRSKLECHRDVHFLKGWIRITSRATPQPAVRPASWLHHQRRNRRRRRTLTILTGLASPNHSIPSRTIRHWI
jgi:hypothetical protein